jgi:hypothetical protein
MKKKIIYLLLMTLPLLVVTSCEEDAIGTPDLNYITFEAAEVDLKVDKGSTNSASYKIYSSIMSDASRTFNVTVSDKSTADPVSYTIPASITMPANSNVASLEIDVEDINIISSRELILTLEEKNGLYIGNDNEFTINLLRICVSSIAGSYTYENGKPATVTETSPGNYEVSGDSQFGSNYPFNINDACDVISVTGGFLPDAYGIPIAGAGMVMPDGSIEITYTVDGYFTDAPMVLTPN